MNCIVLKFLWKYIVLFCQSVIKAMYSFPMRIAVMLAFWLDLHRHKDQIFNPMKPVSKGSVCSSVSISIYTIERVKLPYSAPV